MKPELPATSRCAARNSFRRRFPFLPSLLFFPLLLALSACTGLSPPREGEPLPARPEVRNFAVEGRFALRSGKEAVSGRLSWQHFEAGSEEGGERGADALLLSSPIGQGMAELIVTSMGAQLNTSDGRHYSGSDPERLLLDVLGVALPLRELPRLLPGQPRRGDTVEWDSIGRPRVIEYGGWTVEYGYAGELSGELPKTVEAKGREGLLLRLIIESWDFHSDPQSLRPRLFGAPPPENFMPPVRESGKGAVFAQ
ncbi:MAG: outer membrane lipoprotein LolB [Betaproteobacteria bacterium]|nr:outer membrane lipoprotein LolB [Betaproteobacteria bacterium]